MTGSGAQQAPWRIGAAVAAFHVAVLWLAWNAVNDATRPPVPVLTGALVAPAAVEQPKAATPVVAPPRPLPAAPRAEPPPAVPRTPKPAVLPPKPSPAPQVVQRTAPVMQARSETSTTTVAEPQPQPPPQPSAPAPAPAPTPVPPVAAAPAPAPAPAADSPPAAPKDAVVAPRSDASHLNNPAPQYPPVSRKLGEQGQVLLDVHILPDGSVGDMRLKRSSGFDRLDEAAMRAVRRWRYVPARRGDEPIAWWYVQPIVFALGS